MKLLTGTLLAATLSTAAFATQAEVMVLEEASFEDSNYYLLTSSSWDDAQAKAIELGGNLITINSFEENSFIRDLWLTGGTSSFATDFLWLGLTDRDEEGVFSWVSGETFDYENFRPVEPNNAGSGENYVQMIGSGKWNDIGNDPESRIVFGVVEINFGDSNLSDVPTPLLGIGMLGLLGLAAGRSRKANA